MSPSGTGTPSDDAHDASSDSGSAASGPVPGSGDAAVAAAAERAEGTRGLNVPTLPDLPVPDDTANLRLGPDLNHALLAVLPLVGVWRGEGEGRDLDGTDYRFGQQIVVSHNGGEYLSWNSQTWVLGEDGDYLREDQRETGFWRVTGDPTAGANNDEVVELLLTHASGVVELYYGEARTQSSWELATDVVIRTTSGALVGGAKRLYGIVDGGDLAYVEERVLADGELQPRMSARLSRYIG
ncbi:FABP family protein [Rhodococcus rhodnii]|uniref:Ferric nitrobindin-like protein n=2 Tax=Rhodococcus rhodnii TaxID=38312 RepID=R7WH38_9NOCA|nr:FABP family protein [Rhodococcus rhodnii]EOM74386.1 hypothetical protein Rrhod_4188 [Rhodococcus rhodnii LMG 5362]TXG89106.1 FABP family protein [Rhodococcus rhodnii]